MSELQTRSSHRLLQAGILLFLLGLLGGFVVPFMANPRMGLSSHLEGIMNGIVLMVLGLIWPKLRLGNNALITGYWLALFGTYTNWTTTLTAGFLGAGEATMPLASTGHRGSDVQEILIGIGLVSLSLAMIAVCGIVLYGLRRPATTSP